MDLGKTNISGTCCVKRVSVGRLESKGGRGHKRFDFRTSTKVNARVCANHMSLYIGCIDGLGTCSRPT